MKTSKGVKRLKGARRGSRVMSQNAILHDLDSITELPNDDTLLDNSIGTQDNHLLISPEQNTVIDIASLSNSNDDMIAEVRNQITVEAQIHHCENSFSDPANTAQKSTKVRRQKKTSAPNLCLTQCKYKRKQGNEDMLRCCICMAWVYPSCCGDSEESLNYTGGYHCSICRQIPDRILQIEKHMENLHNLNATLIKQLENSQEECANLREIIKVLTTENRNTKDLLLDPENTSIVSVTSKSAKPIPAPRRPKPKPKPRITMLGESSISGCGTTLSNGFPDHHTCVLSKAELNLEEATNIVPDIVNDYNQEDLLVLHLGKNDIQHKDNNKFVDKFVTLVEKSKSAAPKCPIAVSGLPKQMNDDNSKLNVRIEKLNSRLKGICNSDPQLTFIDCCPKVTSQNYRNDGRKFNNNGKNCLLQI